MIGNGDIFDAAAAEGIFKHTGCDAILVSRGTMGAPWIVEDIMRHLTGEAPVERDVSFLRASLMEHFESIVSYQNERQALLDFRRVGCWYLKECVGAKPLRMQLNQATTTREVFELVEGFSWQALSTPLKGQERLC